MNILGAKISEKDKKLMMHGPSERDIVYSGLEDTMATAVNETLTTMRVYNVQPRIGAFINALKKIENCYKDAGLTLG